MAVPARVLLLPGAFVLGLGWSSSIQTAAVWGLSGPLGYVRQSLGGGCVLRCSSLHTASKRGF